jgi:hypothetical protein
VIQQRTLEEFLKEDRDIQWCLHDMKAVHIKEVAKGLWEGTAMAVCDGSFKETFGTAAWIIRTNEGEASIRGCVHCPGAPDDHSSYRSELAGIYAVLTVTNKLCKFFQIKDGRITLGCDGLSALNVSMTEEPSLASDIPNFDLVAAIYNRRRVSTLEWDIKFVKGHQDNCSSSYDIWAWLNEQMDLLAKQHMKYALNAPRHYSVKEEPWQLWVAGRKITGKIQQSIYSLVHDQEANLYWATKKDVAKESLPLLDRAAIGTAM